MVNSDLASQALKAPLWLPGRVGHDHALDIPQCLELPFEYLPAIQL